MGRRDAGTQGRRDAGTQGRFALLAAFCAFFGTAFGGEVYVTYSDGTQSDVQAAVGRASNGDTLLFPESTFVFDGAVSVEGGKSLGLWGAGLSGSGRPLTVLEKSDACRFFDFAGDGGGGTGVRSIAFDGKELPVDGYGGAIYCDDSFAGAILNSSFVGNK
ncbi:MAG: hypothetical protein LBF24_01110, partial [Puniceicoccales bacterium]|nr:hypothetical protein [Puniceicoccales bacterium]